MEQKKADEKFLRLVEEQKVCHLVLYFGQDTVVYTCNIFFPCRTALAFIEYYF